MLCPPKRESIQAHFQTNLNFAVVLPNTKRRPSFGRLDERELTRAIK
jgi:hypothetical protein